MTSKAQPEPLQASQIELAEPFHYSNSRQSRQPVPAPEARIENSTITRRTAQKRQNSKLFFRARSIKCERRHTTEICLGRQSTRRQSTRRWVSTPGCKVRQGACAAFVAGSASSRDRNELLRLAEDLLQTLHWLIQWKTRQTGMLCPFSFRSRSPLLGVPDRGRFCVCCELMVASTGVFPG
jgi:hypothetical protein